MPATIGVLPWNVVLRDEAIMRMDRQTIPTVAHFADGQLAVAVAVEQVEQSLAVVVKHDDSLGTLRRGRDAEKRFQFFFSQSVLVGTDHEVQQRLETDGRPALQLLQRQDALFILVEQLENPA